ncbi:MarR family transcriptional regulator [Arthrobacter sp. TMT4-20]
MCKERGPFIVPTEPRTGPGSQKSLRNRNLASIQRNLIDHGQLTQIELAQVTGLSPATVSNLVKVLLTEGEVSSSPTTRSGRRAKLISSIDRKRSE